MPDSSFYEEDEGIFERMESRYVGNAKRMDWTGADDGIRVEASRRTYFAVHLDTGAIKVGQSNNPERRIRELQRAFGGRIRLLTTLESGLIERELHQELASHSIGKEWYRPCPKVLIALFSALDRHERNR